ncbi:MAG: hypothetical protein JNJ73_03140 [Hyphomonadaceae bacterium]|nr:hypothetical protein [Hyphomonadaceae bacterium]
MSPERLGRWIMFGLMATVLGCQGYFIDKRSRDDVARLPKYEALRIVEGPIASVALAPCKYSYRGRRNTLVCHDVFLVTLDTHNGPQVVETFLTNSSENPDTIEEWNARIGQPAAAAVGAPCHAYKVDVECVFDLQVGPDHPVRYDRVMKRVRGAALAGLFFLGAVGALILLVILVLPTQRPTPA